MTTKTGFESSLGCESETTEEEMPKKQTNKCKRFEATLSSCDYTCEVPGKHLTDLCSLSIRPHSHKFS